MAARAILRDGALRPLGDAAGDVSPPAIPMLGALVCLSGMLRPPLHLRGARNSLEIPAWSAKPFGCCSRSVYSPGRDVALLSATAPRCIGGRTASVDRLCMRAPREVMAAGPAQPFSRERSRASMYTSGLSPVSAKMLAVAAHFQKKGGAQRGSLLPRPASSPKRSARRPCNSLARGRRVQFADGDRER